MNKLFQYFLAFNTYFEDPTKAKLHWLVLLRWFMISFILLIAFMGFISKAVSSIIFVYLVGFISVLLLLNIISQFVWLNSKKKLNEIVLAFQLTFDLMILFGILAISGSLTNPFYILIYFNIAVGAFFLSGWHTWLFWFLCHQVLLVLQFLTVRLQDYSNLEIIIPSYHTFIIQHLVMIMSFFMSLFLARFMNELHLKVLKLTQIQSQQDRLRSLGALLAGFSHELATPLNTIKLRVERELRQNPESENLQLLKVAALQCENVISQINQSQLDHRATKNQRFNLVSFIKEIANLWCNENQVDITKMFFLECLIDSATVEVSQVSLSQVLFNLFDNAFEANSQTKIQIIIESENRNEVRVTISNSGSQFSQAILNHLGEPFNTNKVNGVGLGLYSIMLFMDSISGEFKAYNQDEKACVELKFKTELS